MKKTARLLLAGCTMAAAAGTIAVPAGPAGAIFGCHPNDSLFNYTVNYSTNARFIAADKNHDGLLCIKNKDPQYDGNPLDVTVYDNNPSKA